MKLRRAVLILTALILLLGGWFLLFGGIKDHVTAEAGSSVDISDFSEHIGFFQSIRW